MIKELYSLKIKNDYYRNKINDNNEIPIDILYFDINTLDNQTHESSWVKSVLLPEITNSDLSKDAADFLYQNIAESHFKPLSNTSKPLCDLSKDEIVSLRRKIWAQIMQISIQIFSEGKFGVATTVVLNQKTYDEYIILNNDFEYIINENIHDNDIFILNNAEEYAPGYKFVYLTDESAGKLYGKMIIVGLNPELQAYKYVI